nr:unnamed protein product [Callosobruchus analis]
MLIRESMLVLCSSI